MIPSFEFYNISGRFALHQVSFSVQEGEFVSLIGPTGSGKSTLLNLAAGLLSPAAGEIRCFGERLVGLNRSAGYLFQSDSLMPWFNARDNVAAGLIFRDIPWQEARAQASRWLERVGLSKQGDLFPGQLSGGMRKRVALAQSFIVDPKILLMDEPFSSLDVQTRQLMENELLALWSLRRKSVLFVTHDLEEAISLSDRVLVLSAGPEAHIIGEFRVPLPRPRDVQEIRFHPQFAELHREIWHQIKSEVLKSYAEQER